MLNMPHALWLTLAMLCIGVLFRLLKVLPENAAEVVNKLVLNLCLPALVFSVVSRLEFQRALLWVPLIAWTVMAMCALVLMLISRQQKWPREVEGALLLTGVLGNTAFLGYPLTQAYLGEASIGTAVLYDQLGSFLVFSTFGLWVAARYGAGKTPTAAATALKILTFPAFLSLLAAIAAGQLGLRTPPEIMRVLDDVKALLVPLAMLAIGLNFSLIPPTQQKVALLLGLSVKMALAPLLALGLARLVLSKDAMHIVAFEAAMPPMATAAALAANAKLAPQLAAAMAGFGILLALFWLPLLHQWLN
jgi:malate permease and related proteins